MRNHFLTILVLTGAMSTLHAQEILLPLSNNPAKSPEALRQHIKATGERAPLQLPIWDDFTYEGPYPNASIWADQFVFINSGYGVHPKTYGVATFDILDEHGDIYDHATMDNIPFSADHLTSHPINMGDLTPADSVLLTFYYQPEGRGGNPSSQDSLIVEFLLPGNNQNDESRENDDNGMIWTRVWGAPGESLQSFSQDTFPYFKRAVIPIVDEQFFRDDFRFRFRNYSSFPPGQTIPNYSGTAKIWNIDYVYLDKNRSIPDSTYYDIAFAAPAQSMLRNYTAIPWSQYIANPPAVLRDNFNVLITNLDNNAYNYTYRYIIQDEDKNTIRTYSGGTWVIAPFIESGYQQHPQHANPIVLLNPLPTAPAPQRHFRIIHSIREGTTGDDRSRNDTIAYLQAFTNYFAYDDGNPEMISLIKGFSPSRAVQIVTNHPDTLEAVRIFLMETLNNQDNQQSFQLTVWSSLEPEEIIYQSEDPLFLPEDRGTGFISFYPQEYVLVSDTFYVGFQQTGNVNLNNSMVIGFDTDNDVSHRYFNNFGDGFGWQPSVANGSLMIRAVMKRDVISHTGPGLVAEESLTIYPNPASGHEIHIRLENFSMDEAHTSIQIFDMQGRLVYTGGFTSLLNIAGLGNGVYLMRVSNAIRGRSHTGRFIITR